ncbi:MAG: translation initiation factor IF-2 [Synechococcales cyanobacterium]
MPISDNVTHSQSNPSADEWDADSKRASTDKIRIYDLSREMGRENKDILDACDHLQIGYKSHSSTISGEQAEQIRGYLGEPRPSKPTPMPVERTPERSPERRLIIRPKVNPPTQPSSEEATASPPISPPDGSAENTVAPSLKNPPPRPSVRVHAPQPPAPAAVAEMPPTVTPPTVTPPTVTPPAPPPTSIAVPPTLAAPPKPPSRPAPLPEVKPEPSKPEVVKPDRLERVDRGERSKPTPPSPPRRPSRAVEPSPTPSSVTASSDPVKPRLPSSPKPQLIGAPTRPGTRLVTPPAAKAEPSASTVAGDPVASPRKLIRPAVELTAPPSRPVAPTGPTLADAPVRPPSRPPIKKAEDEDDEETVAKRLAGKGQTKKKRRRGVEDFENPEDVSSLSGAIHTEAGVYKPLPRPGSKPGGARPAAVATFKPKAKPTPAGRGRAVARAAEVADTTPEKPTSVVIAGDLTVQELASRLQIAETQIIKHLFLQGKMVNITQVLEASVAEKVAVDLGYSVEHGTSEAAARKTEMLDLEDIEYLSLRPPVVTIMGHVDHGKTTLLDAIRQTKVAAGEAGGITQHIGAYHVDVTYEGEPQRVVFLDTPGHEAFTAMRARGAKVTDIAVLVVAADDGVQPQTLEALSHARAANVPIVVAINKIDKPGSQPDRIKQELSEHALVPEEWGGDTPMVEVSALTRLNLDQLLETLLIVAEVAELQANPDRLGKGTVIEANMDKARGAVATMLVQNGTLRVGDALVAGAVFGRVKAMVDDRGQRVTEAPPSSAVQILGLNGIPAAGDEFEVYADESLARQVAKDREDTLRQQRLQQNLLARRVSLGTASSQAQEGQLKELNIILKTDVQGSAEAIVASLQQLPSQEVQLRVLMASPGEITETDIDLAAASSALVLGFSTTQAPGARQAADRYGVDIREYDIIYNLLEDITAAMEGLLEPDLVEEPMGQAEVRQVIPIAKGLVAGSYILSGKVQRNAFVRVRRKNDIIFEGRIDSLRRFKDDVREVAAGFECGISLDKFHDWQGGEILDVYQMVTKRRSLTSK